MVLIVGAAVAAAVAAAAAEAAAARALWPWLCPCIALHACQRTGAVAVGVRGPARWRDALVAWGAEERRGGRCVSETTLVTGVTHRTDGDRSSEPAVAGAPDLPHTHGCAPPCVTPSLTALYSLNAAPPPRCRWGLVVRANTNEPQTSGRAHPATCHHVTNRRLRNNGRSSFVAAGASLRAPTPTSRTPTAASSS